VIAPSVLSNVCFVQTDWEPLVCSF